MNATYDAAVELLLVKRNIARQQVIGIAVAKQHRLVAIGVAGGRDQVQPFGDAMGRPKGCIGRRMVDIAGAQPGRKGAGDGTEGARPLLAAHKHLAALQVSQAVCVVEVQVRENHGVYIGGLEADVRQPCPHALPGVDLKAQNRPRYIALGAACEVVGVQYADLLAGIDQKGARAAFDHPDPYGQPMGPAAVEEDRRHVQCARPCIGVVGTLDGHGTRR
ncbi:MAG: hypothetical protein OHK0039_38450 [Bacteroidia bacterium]